MGGKTTPIEGSPRVGSGERGLDQGPASDRLAALAVLAALGGPPGGRSTRPPRRRDSSSASAGQSGTSGKSRSGDLSGDISSSRSLSRSRVGRRGSSSRSRGLSGSLSGGSISLCGPNRSRKAPSLNNAAQDSRSRDSRLIGDVTETGDILRGSSNAGPGIVLRLSARRQYRSIGYPAEHLI